MTISGAVMPRSARPRSRAAFTAMRMLSVPPDVMKPAAPGGAVEQVGGRADDLGLDLGQARERAACSARSRAGTARPPPRRPRAPRGRRRRPCRTCGRPASARRVRASSVSAATTSVGRHPVLRQRHRRDGTSPAPGRLRVAPGYGWSPESGWLPESSKWPPPVTSTLEAMHGARCRHLRACPTRLG